VAARGTRAAAGEASDHRVLGDDFGFGLEPLCRRFCAATARARLGREPHCRAAARALGFEVVKLEIRRAEDIAPAFEALKGGADALYVCGDPLVNTNRVRINTLALAARLPTMHFVKVYVEAGGLMSYGPSFVDLFRRSGDYVDKILRGVKPGDIPIEQPIKFELVINLKTAKALGLQIPDKLLAVADEVIE
jgi:putative ABC transport system substrate-binding protein